jgi:hypothetical protein
MTRHPSGSAPCARPASAAVTLCQRRSVLALRPLCGCGYWAGMAWGAPSRTPTWPTHALARRTTRSRGRGHDATASSASNPRRHAPLRGRVLRSLWSLATRGSRRQGEKRAAGPAQTPHGATRPRPPRHGAAAALRAEAARGRGGPAHAGTRPTTDAQAPEPGDDGAGDVAVHGGVRSGEPLGTRGRCACKRLSQPGGIGTGGRRGWRA